MIRITVEMRKPDGTLIRVYNEDVKHREGMGWKVVKKKIAKK